MGQQKRKPTTVYLDPRLAKVVKVKAALTGESVSDMVNNALADRLRRDEENLRVVRNRRAGSFQDYEVFLREMKRDGLI